MQTNHYEQKVTISDLRRENKKKSDLLSRGVRPVAVQQVFNTYYREQVSALYKAVCGMR
jgi:hypothetical protein